LCVALLRKVVGAAMEGSEPLREAMASIKTQLEETNVDVNVPWMDPDASQLKANRVMAAQFILTLPDFGPPCQKALALRDQVEREVACSYRTVGWLMRSAESWRLRSGSTIPPQGDLHVIVLGDDKRAEWRNVGKIADGKPKIDATDGSSLAEGRPVFIKTSP
jgi:hypothetical protein